MKHFLRPIEIEQGQYDRLAAVAQRCVDAARVRADDGTWIYTPAGSGKYTGIYMRDFCYTVEGAGSLMPPEEIKAAIEYLLARQREDGTMPNRVNPDGSAVFVVHGTGGALSHPPTDNAPFAVKLVKAYVDLTGDWDLFIRWSNALMNGLLTVPLSDKHLVFVDPAHPHSGYGFADTVGKTGEVTFSSLLYWEACMVMAQMSKSVEDHDGAHQWFEAAEKAGQNLYELYRERRHMYVAANGDCEQTDLWASAYAGVIRACSKRETVLIGQFLFDNYDRCFMNGCVRHLQAGEYWERMLAEVPPETYQNGGYWPVAAGWVAMVLDRFDPATARMFLDEVIDELEASDAPEWINDGVRDAPLYVASAANVLAVVKGV